jgi:hypothetical protein
MATAYFLAACLELPMTNRASVAKRPGTPATLGVYIDHVAICVIPPIVYR